MTEIHLAYQTDGDVEQMLQRLSQALDATSLGEFLTDEVVPYVKTRGRERFANEGDDVTGKWKPLSQVTVGIREASGYGGEHPINRRTGALEAYITGSEPTLIRGTDSASVIYPGRGEADDNIERKMKTAQMGRDKPRTPRRPVLGLNEADLAWTMSELQGRIERRLR